MLEHLFGSRTRVKLLRLFLSNPGKSYFVRELTRKIGERINSVRRELEHLSSIGLLLCEDKDQKKYYRANEEHLLYPELKGLILKSQLSLEHDLAKHLKSIGRIYLLILSGIFTGVLEAKTDILIVGTVNRRSLTRLINQFRKNFDHPLRFTVMTRKEYEYRNSLTDRFLFTILEKKKIVVIDKLSRT